MMMIPKVGSEWITKYGRKVRVDEIVTPALAQDEPFAKVTVLNPGYRTRKATSFGVSRFGPACGDTFLKPIYAALSGSAATVDDI